MPRYIETLKIRWLARSRVPDTDAKSSSYWAKVDEEEAIIIAAHNLGRFLVPRAEENLSTSSA